MPTTAELYRQAVEARRESAQRELDERLARESPWHRFVGQLVGELRDAGAIHVEDAIDIQKQEKFLTWDDWATTYTVSEKNGKCFLDAADPKRDMYFPDFESLRAKIIELAAEATPLEE